MLQPTRKRLLVKLSLLLAFVSLIGIIWAPNDALVAQPAHGAVNSVSTAPTMPTMPTTAPTATKDGHDGDGDKIEEGLDELLGSPLSGAYCKTAGGVGLTYYSSGTFTMNVTGTPVYAYLYWGGRYPSSSNGDNQVQIAINSGELLTVKADKDRESKLGQGMTYHTYQSANLVNDERFAGLLSGFFQVAAQGLRSAGLEKDEGYGIGLVVISQDPSCPTGQINLFYGLDSFDANRQAPFGPNSEVLCVQFTSAASARTLAFQAFVGGAEGANALWYYVGSGLPPTELIANQLGAILEGPPVTVEPPLTSNTGDQWDNYTNSVAIPAGATFACFQFASIPPTQLGDPVATSAVWVNFVSCLYAATATPTPTVTPTATSTATPTPTATPTTVPTPSFTLDIDIESTNPQPGGDIIYRLEYANTSQVTINNLGLRLTIPAYTTANSTQSTAGWNCEGSGPGAVCSFNLGNIAPGAQGAIRFVVTLDTNMPLTGESIVLTVRARDADNLIDLEVNSDVIVIGQQGSLYFLPLIR